MKSFQQLELRFPWSVAATAEIKERLEAYIYNHVRERASHNLYLRITTKSWWPQVHGFSVQKQ